MMNETHKGAETMTHTENFENDCPSCGSRSVVVDPECIGSSWKGHSYLPIYRFDGELKCQNCRTQFHQEHWWDGPEKWVLRDSK